MTFQFVADAVISDTCFGLGKENWDPVDEIFDDKAFHNMWIQFQAASLSPHHPVWVMIFVNLVVYGAVYKDMLTRGLRGLMPIHCYKKNMNYAGVTTYMSTVDTGIIGFYPASSYNQMPNVANPLKRHNLFQVQAPMKNKYKDANGNILS